MRMTLSTRLAVLVTMAACCTATAAAQDGAALRANLVAALAATTSFQIDVTNPQGIMGTVVVQTQLGRAKVQGSGGPHTVSIYAVSGYEYQQFDGGAWQRRKLPPGGLAISPFAAAAAVTPEADKRDASGATFGAFTATTSLPIPGIGTIPNVALECTYDKATLLLHDCTSQYGEFAFHNYNDPKNVVELPADAKTATELPPLTAAGAQGR
jgi:hypothetical protein